MTILAAPTNPAIFTYETPGLKFGPVASGEIGFDLACCGVRWVPVVTDPGVAATSAPRRTTEMARIGVEALMREIEIANRVRVAGCPGADIADRVEGAMKHQWPLAICPKQLTGKGVARIFERPRELR